MVNRLKKLKTIVKLALSRIVNNFKTNYPETSIVWSCLLSITFKSRSVHAKIKGLSSLILEFENVGFMIVLIFFQRNFVDVNRFIDDALSDLERLSFY